MAVAYAAGEGVERYAYAMVPTTAPGVVVHDDWDALGMRPSGSNSISLEAVELPESGVRGGFRAGDPLPYMERNLVAGLFHAAASLGIAERADQVARRGIAGRINGEARPRIQVADNSRARTATSRPARSCTRLAQTAPTTTSAESLSAKRRRSTEMAIAAPSPSAPTPDPRSFRDALGRFAIGVAFVTGAPDGEPSGLIVNSLTSVSLEPPLVSFCPSRSSLTWSRIRRTRRFGVNVLGRHQERFAMDAIPAGADRFAGVDWEPGRGGVPLLTYALASLDCEIVDEHPAGDHWIVVGQVDELRTSPISDPLVFFAGAFGPLR